MEWHITSSSTENERCSALCGTLAFHMTHPHPQHKAQEHHRRGAGRMEEPEAGERGMQCRLLATMWLLSHELMAAVLTCTWLTPDQASSKSHIERVGVSIVSFWIIHWWCIEGKIFVFCVCGVTKLISFITLKIFWEFFLSFFFFLKYNTCQWGDVVFFQHSSPYGIFSLLCIALGSCSTAAGWSWFGVALTKGQTLAFYHQFWHSWTPSTLLRKIYSYFLSFFHANVNI